MPPVQNGLHPRRSSLDREVKRHMQKAMLDPKLSPGHALRSIGLECPIDENLIPYKKPKRRMTDYQKALVAMDDSLDDEEACQKNGWEFKETDDELNNADGDAGDDEDDEGSGPGRTIKSSRTRRASGPRRSIVKTITTTTTRKTRTIKTTTIREKAVTLPRTPLREHEANSSFQGRVFAASPMAQNHQAAPLRCSTGQPTRVPTSPLADCSFHISPSVSPTAGEHSSSNRLHTPAPPPDWAWLFNGAEEPLPIRSSSTMAEPADSIHLPPSLMSTDKEPEPNDNRGDRMQLSGSSLYTHQGLASTSAHEDAPPPAVKEEPTSPSLSTVPDSQPTFHSSSQRGVWLTSRNGARFWVDESEWEEDDGGPIIDKRSEPDAEGETDTEY